MFGAAVGDRESTGLLQYHEFAAARAGQLFRIAYLMCGDWHEAQDLVQTCLAKLYASWHRIQKSESVDAYARKALLHTFLSHRRLRRSSEIPIADFGDRRAPGDNADLRMVLIDALATLSPRNRAAVVLRYLDDHSVESVAEMLDTTPAAVKSSCNRSLKQLRALLGDDRELLFQD
jgi:RNA polymerase sigma-70 factor (sigma-E family)